MPDGKAADINEAFRRYDETLSYLRDTEGFFQRESKEYREFRDSLKDLNEEMAGCGDRVLTADQVYRLRELTAKAIDTYAAYRDRLNETGAFNKADEGRKRALGGLDFTLRGDLEALRIYDYKDQMSLEQVIFPTRRAFTDMTDQEWTEYKYKDVQWAGPMTAAQYGGGMVDTRIRNRDGIFIEDFEVPDYDAECQRIRNDYPEMSKLLGDLQWDRGKMEFFASVLPDSPARLERALLDKSNFWINAMAEEIQSSAAASRERFGDIEQYCPAAYRKEREDDDRTWFNNPGFIHQFSEAFFRLGETYKRMEPYVANLSRPGSSTRDKLVGMSMMADRLGMKSLLPHTERVNLEVGDLANPDVINGMFIETIEGVSPELMQRTFLPGITGSDRIDNSDWLIKSASNLQVLDYICGNTNRRSGNIAYQYDYIDGKQVLRGVRGLQNHTGFGAVGGEKSVGGMTAPDGMRVMTQSTAEAVLRLTKEELKYSLYGLATQEEMDYAWHRVELLQKKIKESLKVKWKSESDLRPGAIHILPDNSGAWARFDTSELSANEALGEIPGIFDTLKQDTDTMRIAEKRFGASFEAHTQSFLRQERYPQTRESSVYDTTFKVDYPDPGNDITDKDIYSLYQNRGTLHNDAAAIKKGSICFDNVFGKLPNTDGQIHEDIGWVEPVDKLYIDGVPAVEYVKKYSPENAGNKDYVKAQVMAAITSGRHHVDMVMLRTQHDGTFKATATELVMDLKALSGQEHLLEASRETKRKFHESSESSRLERQSKIENSVVQMANAAAEKQIEDIAFRDRERFDLRLELYGQGKTGPLEEEIDKILLSRERKRIQGITNQEILRQRREAAGRAAERAAKAPAKAPAEKPAEAAAEAPAKKPAQKVTREPISLKDIDPEPRKNPQPHGHPGQKQAGTAEKGHAPAAQKPAETAEKRPGHEAQTHGKIRT